MILTEYVKVRINPSNFYHYLTFYEDIEIEDIISVKVSELTKSSREKIKVKCDNCGREKEIRFINYKEDENGEYLCKNCKRDRTIKNKYNVDNIFQSEEIKNKSRKTIKKKYGVDNISKSQFIKNKKNKNKQNK